MITEQRHDCKSSQRREIILPEDHKQYSRIECAVCGRWITWGRSPLVTEEHKQRIKVIDKCLKIGFGFSLWQTEFLKSIRDKRVLTEKQTEFFENITAIYK